MPTPRASVIANVIAIIGLCGVGHADSTPAVPPPVPVLDLDQNPFLPGTIVKEKQKVPAGTVESVEGKFGKAVKFSFVEGASGGFHTARLHPTGEWDAADGFSFWVKGDGSNSWGGIEIIDRDDHGLRYGYCFPIDSIEWKKITVRWTDLMPELAGPLAGGKEGYPSSHFGTFSFGKFYFWQTYPAHSFTVDRVVLEPKIAMDSPVVAKFEPGLKRLCAKLARHETITIVTMGDSLTDEHHWSNREVVWHGLLAKALKAKYGSDVKIVNPAIGGTTLNQNVILMPRWEKDAPEPDLVTVWFGGNDWDNKVRGPRFGEYLRLCVERIREQTHGHADILLMTNIPSHYMWETRKEIEAVTKDVAKEKRTGLAEVGDVFREVGSADDAFKQGYWGFDKVHLGKKGHELTSDVVMKAIESGE